MSFRSAIFGTTSLVLLASSASADVSAKEIWSDWKAYMTGFGYAVEAQEAMSGNTLQVTDLKMSVPMPEATGSFDIVLEQVDFIENGDGTVNMVFPNIMPMNFVGQGPKGEDVSGSLVYTMQNMTMQASGDPAKIVYNYAADQIGVSLDGLTLEGEKFPADALNVNFTSQNLQGQSIMEPGALRKIAQVMTLGATSYTVAFSAPGGNETVNLEGNIASMSFDGDTFMPAMMNPEDMSRALADGFALDGSLGYTDAKTNFSFTDGEDAMDGSSSADSAVIGVRMNKDLLEYNGTSKGVNFNLSGAEIPFPVVAGLGEVAFNLLMPVAKSDDESDFAFGLTLGDFVTSDMIWSMLDAGNVLPRDPATISLDLTGKAKMLVDFFDPEQMSAVEDGEAMPAELNAITLRKLLVSAAGAKLTGTGDFTFDNTDTESFGGMPKPTGGIDLNLVGGNGLMDKLVQIGLLPQEQAMGARMMMGLFARQGPGEDEINTSVEINEQGHILANGQRIQ